MAKTDELTLLQITDMHLQDDPAVDMKGVNPEQRFLSVLEQVGKETADLLLLTGDLTHHAPNAYPRLVKHLQPLSTPCCWIPGNHDLPDVMLGFESGKLNQKCIDLPDWRILLLDSTSMPDGRGSGSLSEDELDFLKYEIERCDSELHLLVVLHHHPLSVNSEWQDQIGLGNADDFWNILSQSNNVRGVMFGHIHQALEVRHKDIPLFSAPATAAQFVPATHMPEVETDELLATPAYARYTLTPDGNITVNICRVTA